MIGKGKKDSISYIWISNFVRNIVTCVKNFCAILYEVWEVYFWWSVAEISTKKSPIIKIVHLRFDIYTLTAIF